MPLIRIDAYGDAAEPHNKAASADLEVSRHDDDGPAIVMVHGYSYRPGNPKHCPHRTLFSLETGRREPGWPRHLGFGGGHDAEGLAVAFGWDARGTPRAAHDRTVPAGRALSDIVRLLKNRVPRRPVHVIAHSMGIEPVLEAMHHLPAGALDRILSLNGAAYHSRVLAALNTLAGRTSEFINITSRENDAFDFMFERLIARPQRGDRSIGLGLSSANALTLRIDCTETLTHLAGMGAPIAAPDRLVCHHSAYTRPGMLRLCNALMRNPDIWTMDALRAGLPFQRVARWSRLLAFRLPAPTLQGPQKAA